MGLGKIFTGISIILGWVIIKFMIIENIDFLKTVIPTPMGRASFLNTFHSIEPAIWIIVILVGLGIIFWGIKD